MTDNVTRWREEHSRFTSLLAAIERAVPLEPDPLVAASSDDRFTNLRRLLARAAEGASQ